MAKFLFHLVINRIIVTSSIQTNQLEANDMNRTEQVLQALSQAVTTDKNLYGGDLTIAANTMKAINNVSASVTVSSLEVNFFGDESLSSTITFIYCYVINA